VNGPSLEQALVRQVQAIRRLRETAKGPAANMAAGAARGALDATLAILEEHGDPELRAIAARVLREY